MHWKLKNMPLRGLAFTRSRLGLSQNQLALRLGVSKSLIAMAEAGKRPLTHVMIIKIARLEHEHDEAAEKNSSGSIQDN